MKKIIVTIFLFAFSVQLFSQLKKKKATLFFRDGTELSCLARIAGENIRYTKENIKDDEIMVNEKELKGLKIWLNNRPIEFYYKLEEGKSNFKRVELLNSDKMKLFRNLTESSNLNNYQDTFSNTYFFLESKNNKDQIIRVTNNFEDFARNYFSDCKSLV
jgi:hypothetical protein